MHRREILVVEPDKLTEWSLRTYLSKWFSVHSTNSTGNAELVLGIHPVDVLVISDELPPAALVALESKAREINPQVSIVQTVTDPDAPDRIYREWNYLEKPFALAQLARLLGIPEEELSGE